MMLSVVFVTFFTGALGSSSYFGTKGGDYDANGYGSDGFDVFGFDRQGLDAWGRPATDPKAGLQAPTGTIVAAEYFAATVPFDRAVLITTTVEAAGHVETAAAMAINQEVGADDKNLMENAEEDDENDENDDNGEREEAVGLQKKAKKAKKAKKHTKAKKSKPVKQGAKKNAKKTTLKPWQFKQQVDTVTTSTGATATTSAGNDTITPLPTPFPTDFAAFSTVVFQTDLWPSVTEIFV